MLRLLPLVSLLATSPAQGLRLVDRVEAPIAYVRYDAAGGAAPAGPGAVARLLADPGLEAFVASGDGAAAPAWGLVRGMLARRCVDFELALTGVVPGAGRPLLLLRLQLPPAEAERLQGLLGEGGVATAHRAIDGRQTYRLHDRLAAPAAAPAGPGGLVELALVGNDLLVGNDDLGMQELLGPAPTTSSALRRVLAADPEFLALRQRLELPAGSLVAYGDWQRLGHRLQDDLRGVPGALLDWSGVGGARRVLLSLAPASAGVAATLLLSFGPATAAAPGGAIDGWLAAVQHVPARQLQPELPAAGLGGVVVAVDLAGLAQRSPRAAHLVRDLRHSLDDYGLDFDRHVLGRLSALGTVQLLLRDGSDGVAQEVVAVYAVRARSRAAAADLFTDLRRAAEAHGIGRLTGNRDRRGPDVLELRPMRDPDAGAQAPFCVAVVEDTVLVALDAATLQRVHDDYRRAGRSRGRRDAVVTGAMQRIGPTPVCGLFDLELGGLFASLARPNDGVRAAWDLSSVPARHVGSLACEPGADGAVVRICVLSMQ
ncbi:MAG: hypothetical protein KF830_11940 [Planctomycetes bacterium]|nr:hypothetical protein [Planctomycetota bacterium]